VEGRSREVLSRHLPGKADENYEKGLLEYTISGHRFELWMSQIRSRRSPNHSVNFHALIPLPYEYSYEQRG
jgi:hypothetical protein